MIVIVIKHQQWWTCLRPYCEITVWTSWRARHFTCRMSQYEYSMSENSDVFMIASDPFIQSKIIQWCKHCGYCFSIIQSFDLRDSRFHSVVHIQALSIIVHDCEPLVLTLKGLITMNVRLTGAVDWGRIPSLPPDKPGLPQRFWLSLQQRQRGSRWSASGCASCIDSYKV